MNNQRRKQISDLAVKLEDIKNEIEILREEEQDALDNMPESLQGSERGEVSQAAIDALDSAMSDVESAMNSLDEAQS